MQEIQQTRENPRILIHPIVDFLMIGGLSIFFYIGFIVFHDPSKDTNALGWTMFYLSFAINFPHFLISYQHFYGDHRKRLLSDWKWLGVAWVVPIIFISYVAWAAWTVELQSLGWLVNLMFVLVGWHYVKQIFGCVIVTGHRARYPMNSRFREALRSNLFSIWALSYVNGNRAIGQLDFYSLKYLTIALPDEAMWLAWSAVAISLVWLLKELVDIYIKEGRWPSFLSITAWVAIYVWYLPTLYSPAYFLMIPAFHSLQYLLFSWTYTSNRVREQSQNHHDDEVQRRAYFVKKFFAYLGSSFILGALFFNFIPNWLDGENLYARDILGATFFMACFQLFLNIHHYLIDHLIWRGHLPEVRKYLLS